MTDAEIRAQAISDARAFVKALGGSFIGLSLEDMVDEEMTFSAIVARTVLVSSAVTVLKAVDQAIATGVAPEGWRRDDDRMKDIVTTCLKQSDPRIAFQASLRSAYSAGRFKRAERTGMPLMVYRSMRDSRVRDSHKAINGVALPRDDAWWDIHYPPNGWRCRCKAYAITESDLQDLESAGVPVQRKAPAEKEVTWLNPRTGKKKVLPESVEPDWDHHVGKDSKALAGYLDEHLKGLANWKPIAVKEAKAPSA